MLRGNVDTRLSKLAEGRFDAILLAAAGLNRLGLAKHVSELLDPYAAPPAPGQGALAIETRAADADVPWLQGLKHRPTTIAIAAERGAMAALEGSCRTAIGAHARIEDGRLSLVVEALTGDGGERWRREGEIALGDEAQARALGLELGHQVRDAAGDRLIVA